MVSGSTTPQTPPPLWSLNPTTHKPEDKEAFFNALTYLALNPSWVEQNPEKAKEYFDRLEITDISSLANTVIFLTNLNDQQVISIYQKMLPLREKLFPQEKAKENWMRLCAGQEGVQIPKNLLSALSPKFGQALAHEMTESRTRILDITETGINPEDARSFIEYLKNGEIELTADNILPLLHLATEHVVPKLETLCIDWLRNYVLEDFNLDSFAPLCEFASQQDNQILSQLLLQLAQERMKDLGIELHLSDWTLTIKEAASPEAWTFLRTVGQLHIKQLEIYSREETLTELDLSSHFPHLKKIVCRELEALKTLIAPQIEEFECHNCKVLSKLDIRNAIIVSCYSCDELKELDVPKAVEVTCSFCNTLPKLFLPEAKQVNCSFCGELKELDAQKASLVRRWACPALKTMKVPSTAAVISR